MFSEVVEFIKSLYPGREFIPLHAPSFVGSEKQYLSDCIDSTFVSSVGEYVNKFEDMICEYTGAPYAIATVNGTSALHVALVTVGVSRESEVLCPALTFVATPNAVAYTGADPVFIDSGAENLGMCPRALEAFLSEYAIEKDEHSYNSRTGKRFSACIPMHVFGHTAEIEKIVSVCRRYKIPVVEDAAESLGTVSGSVHTGLTGDVGVLSFNGNKIITCGGGGMLITQSEQHAERLRHLTTTAKVAHAWNFFHDQVGFNYRLPNLNAALGCAQMEVLGKFVENKRETARRYREFFSAKGIKFIDEPEYTRSNFWLNAIQLKSRQERDDFLEKTNAASVMTRPVWELMTSLPAYKGCQHSEIVHAAEYADTVVNLPSSVR